MPTNVVRELVTLMGFKTDQRSLDKANRSIRRVGNKMRTVGLGMTKAITLPLIAIGAGILKVAADFETSMNRVQVLTNATGAEFKKLEDQAKLLGRTTQFTASESAEAMGFLAQAGFDVNQIYGAMPATLALAAASAQDLATTADQLSNIMTQFKISAEDSSRVADILAKTASSTNTNITQLAEAMSFAGGLANELSLSIEETSALLGLMGNAGIQATRAGTTLRRALLQLLSPTPRVTKVLDKLNITVSDGEGGIRNFVDILDDLERAEASAADISEIFGAVATSGILAIVGAGKEMRDAQIAENIDSIGEAQKQAEARTKGLAGRLKILKSAFEGLILKFADESGLSEDATKATESLTKIIDKITELDSQTLKLIKTLGAGAGLAGVLTLIGGILLRINPFVAALSVLIALLVELQKEASAPSFDTHLKGIKARLTPEELKSFIADPVSVLTPAHISPFERFGLPVPNNNTFGSTTVNVNVPKGTSVDQADEIGQAVKNAIEDVFDEKARHLNSQSPK